MGDDGDDGDDDDLSTSSRNSGCSNTRALTSYRRRDFPTYTALTLLQRPAPAAAALLGSSSAAATAAAAELLRDSLAKDGNLLMADLSFVSFPIFAISREIERERGVSGGVLEREVGGGGGKRKEEEGSYIREGEEEGQGDVHGPRVYRNSYIEIFRYFVRPQEKNKWKKWGQTKKENSKKGKKKETSCASFGSWCGNGPMDPPFPTHKFSFLFFSIRFSLFGLFSFIEFLE